MTDHSLQNMFQGNWKQLSGSVHHEWGKLTHNDVEQVKGDVEMLAGKIQKRYGVTEAEARMQIKQWLDNFMAHQAAKASQASSDSEQVSQASSDASAS
jgi:uncharacterized protein YjbJ (UPF0337 family)